MMAWAVELLDHWQSLAGGVLGLIAGILAFGGALIAANRQVGAARQAAKDQVAAVQRQLEHAQAARAESDRRRLSVIRWAVLSEVRRLETAAIIMQEALPSAAGWASRAAEQLIIESSPLLRGEREDIALLDDKTRELLEVLADTLDAYNLHIATAKRGQEGPQILPAVLERIEQLADLADELRREV